MRKLFIFVVTFIAVLSLSVLTVTAATYLWPAPGVSYISCYYGDDGHKGIDIAANGDHTIVASREGTVIAASSTACTHNNTLGDNCNYGMGNYVQIKHSDGTYATYMHMRYASITVSVGQYISRGTKIGMMGSSGNSSGQHLHFQLGYSSSNTINVNPNSLGYDYTNYPSPPTNCHATSQDDSVRIQWEGVVNTDYYECGLIDINTRNIVTKANTNEWCYTFNNIPEGHYWAYACAHNSAGTSSHSNWYNIDVVWYTPGVPTINNIYENFHESDNVTISWNATEYAESYDYYLTEFPTGFAYSTNTRHGNTKDTSVTFKNLTSGKYSIFIHAVSDKGKRSEQSNWKDFNIYAYDYVPTKIISNDNHIYALYDYEMSWNFAKDLCNNLGGHLVTITNEDENKTVLDLIQYGKKNSYWLGASDYDRNDKDFAWVTGEAFEFSSWMPGEPNSDGVDGEKEHFLEVRKSYGNRWNDVNNINKEDKGFILEIETSDITPTFTSAFDGNTYMIFDKNTTWTEAKYLCEMYGGHLMTINNDMENKFLQEFIQNGKRDLYYIGAEKTSGTWKWIDNSKFTNINWDNNSANFDGNYLMIYRQSRKSVGLHNSYFPENDIKHLGFICEIEKKSVLPVISEVETSVTNENLLLINKAEVSLANNSVNDVYGNLVFVYKYTDGNIAKININTCEIPSKENLSVTDSVSNKIVDIANNPIYSVDVYFWSDLNKIIPLSEKSNGIFLYK